VNKVEGNGREGIVSEVERKEEEKEEEKRKEVSDKKEN